MTNDYKDQLLKYVTNNITEETGQDIPSFLPLESYSSTAYDDLTSVIGNDIIQHGQVQCKDANGVENGFMLVYGRYQVNSVLYGYIALFNRDLELIEVITEYKSGTKLSPIIALQVDNEGKLFGIDVHEDKFRFIMLNNITVKTDVQPNYIAILRQSYFIPYGESTQYKETYNALLDKSPIDSRYFMYIYNATGGGSPRLPILLRINVGQANEWTQFNINVVSTAIPPNPIKLYVYYKDDGVDVDLFLQTQNIDQNQCYIEEYTNDLNATTLDNIFMINVVDLMFGDIKNNNNFLVSLGATSIISKSYQRIDYIMASASYQDNGVRKVKTRILNFISNETIYDGEIESTTDYSYATNKLYKLNDIIVATSRTQVSGTNINNTLYRFDAFVITKDDNVAQQTLTNSRFRFETFLDVFAPIVTYNLISFYKLANDLEEGWVSKIAKVVYNPNNYNGNPYEEKRSLLPIQAFIYSNNKLMFARNLYNKVINQNTTNAVVEIPNTMLNGVQLDQQILLGYTNYHLVENSEIIEKNIYENVFVNFFNTLIVQDRNDPNNYITNIPASVRVNNSVSNLVDYEDTTVRKYRINYTSGVRAVRPIMVKTITNNIATLEITLMVNEEIDTIELISGDETTSYITIDTSKLEVGKLYKITQNCHIE